jgi:hypothetical protein
MGKAPNRSLRQPEPIRSDHQTADERHNVLAHRATCEEGTDDGLPLRP